MNEYKNMSTFQTAARCHPALGQKCSWRVGWQPGAGDETAGYKCAALTSCTIWPVLAIRIPVHVSGNKRLKNIVLIWSAYPACCTGLYLPTYRGKKFVFDAPGSVLLGLGLCWLSCFALLHSQCLPHQLSKSVFCAVYPFLHFCFIWIFLVISLSVLFILRHKYICMFSWGVSTFLCAHYWCHSIARDLRPTTYGLMACTFMCHTFKVF